MELSYRDARNMDFLRRDAMNFSDGLQNAGFFLFHPRFSYPDQPLLLPFGGIEVSNHHVPIYCVWVHFSNVVRKYISIGSSYKMNTLLGKLQMGLEVCFWVGTRDKFLSWLK